MNIALPTVTALVCQKCGSAGTSSCNCGVPYVPALRAAAGIAANSKLSDRAIAAQTGVDHKTVAKARKRVGDTSPTEKRMGKDGKFYPTTKKRLAKPKPKPAPDPLLVIQEPCDDCLTEQDRWHRSLASFASDAAVMEAFWDREFGKGWRDFTIPSDIMTLVTSARDAWAKFHTEAKTRRRR